MTRRGALMLVAAAAITLGLCSCGVPLQDSPEPLRTDLVPTASLLDPDSP